MNLLGLGALDASERSALSRVAVIVGLVVVLSILAIAITWIE